MKALALIKAVLRVSVATRCRIGFLICIVAILAIGGSEVLNRIDALNRNSTLVCTAIGILGFLFWIMGRLSKGKRAQLNQEGHQEDHQEGQDAPVEQPAADHPLAFLKSKGYWGVILVLLAAALSCLTTHPSEEPVFTVRARPRPRPSPSPSITITNERPAVTFPPLELQGLIVNGEKSSALINGRVLRIGEDLNNVVLVAVDPEYATVELEGQTKVLLLRQ
jgi:hypothetical protein